MTADRLKGWLEEVRKEAAAEGGGETSRGPGREETEVERETDTNK